jgi:hypothetical protein
VFQKASGYYISESFSPNYEKILALIRGRVQDTGTSDHIVNGDIKVKSGSAIEKFTERGLKFADGSELDADLVVFATG